MFRFFHSLKNVFKSRTFPIFLLFLPLVLQWMAVGPIGLRGAAVQQVFALEISEFEQELALTPSRLRMGSTAMEIVPSS